MPLALADNETTYWTVILILGLIVIITVVAMLSLLIYFIKIIDRRVEVVLDTLESVSDNTADAVLIPQTADEVEAVLAEGLRHHLFLGRVAIATGEGGKSS
jgi:hypothetical protein